MRQNTKFTRANHAFSYISLPSLRLHNYDVKLPNNIMFYGGREQVTTKFSLSIRTWIYVVVYRNSTSGKFANIWQSKWVADKVGELLRTWPLFHNFRPRVLRQEPWTFHLPALWKLQILEFDFFVARKIQNRVSAKVIKFCYWPLQKIP